MENEVLDRSLKAAKNLMTIELKDRQTALEEKIKNMRSSDELKVLRGRRNDIMNGEKSEIIGETKGLRELIEAHQSAMYYFSKDILCGDDQDSIINGGWCLTNEEDNIIIADGVIHISGLEMTQNKTFTLSYTVNTLLMPWIEDARFEIKNYEFSPEDTKDLVAFEAFLDKIKQLELEKHELRKKSLAMDDILLRVETDLLMNQLKSDAVGERAITSIGSLLNKYIDNEALPVGMSFLPEKKE